MKTAKASQAQRGFTFTISMLLLCLTLVAMASFAQEWRKSQQSSFTKILPAEAFHLQERIAADAGEMLGAEASLKKTSQGTLAANVSVQLPFKKEGDPLARMGEYAASLPYNLRNLGFEAVLSANNISGSAATVMEIGGSGRLDFSNDGYYDTAAYYHPSGWHASEINVTIYCGKNASDAGHLSANGTPSGAPDTAYRVNYSDAGGKSYDGGLSAYGINNATFEAAFPDGGKILMESRFSPELQQNYTQVKYTKSPNSALVLPFDRGVGNTTDTSRDYSPAGNNMTPGGGYSDQSPAWSEDCKFSSGCYRFDGSNDYLSRGSLDFPDFPVDYSQAAGLNGGFENWSGSTAANWLLVGNASISPDQSGLIRSGSDAMLMNASGNYSSYIYNTAIYFRNSTRYHLEFWAAAGDAGGYVRYTLYDQGNNVFYSPSGWAASEYFFNSTSTYQAYSYNDLNFTTLPANATNIQIRLYPSPNDKAAYLDDVAMLGMPDFTMMAWVKASSPQQGSSGVFHHFGAAEDGESQGFRWGMNASNFLSMGFDSSNGASPGSAINSSANLSDEKWHLVAFTAVRQGAYYAYLDSVQVGSGANFSLGLLNNSAPFYIGIFGQGGNAFNGGLDEVRFYQRALSAQEIADHYRGRYQSPCSAAFSVSYNASGVSPKAIYTAYNAYLRIRSLPPEVLLSMPFDTNVSSDATGKITDYSRFLTPGTKDGAAWAPDGKVGGAYNFSGTLSKVAVPVPVLSGDIDFTMGAWVYPNSSTGTHYVMGNKGVGNANGTKLALEEGALRFYVANNSIASNVSIAPNSWTHVAGVRKTGIGSIFVNGSEAGSGSLPGAISASPPDENSTGSTILDNFTSTTLDPAWTFTDPIGDSNYSLTALPGRLQINAPAGTSHDCWPGLGYDCPRMLRNANDVDAVYETRIEGVNLLPVDRSTYGIMLYQDGTNFMRFEFRHQFTDQAEAYKIISGSGSNVIASPLSLGSINFLRVTRAGSSYTLDYNIDGSGWNTAGSFTHAGFVVNKVGVYVINAGTNPATTANFDYFSLTQASAPVLLGAFTIGNGPDYGEGFNGMIDEVRVYGKALTEGEIRGLYRDFGLLSNRTLVSSEG